MAGRTKNRVFYALNYGQSPTGKYVTKKSYDSSTTVAQAKITCISCGICQRLSTRMRLAQRLATYQWHTPETHLSRSDAIIPKPINGLFALQLKSSWTLRVACSKFSHMSIGLDAVYEELKRLQLEGMDRVFIEDSTMALLTPAPAPAQPTAPPAQAIDLQSAVSSHHEPSTPAPKVVPRKKTPPATTPLPEPPTIELTDGDAATQMQWLKEQVENSSTCKAQLRQDEKIVFGQGALDADIFYCGEAPSEEEAALGSPFQGAPGELLTKILSAMGLSREAVYMTNIMKWRPKHNKPYGNRPPTQEEMEFCLPYLKAQIAIVKPKVIIALGNATVPGLLGADTKSKIATIRGTWRSLEGTPLIFTYQPSYLLFNDTPKTKRLAWEDMLQAMDKVGLPISEKQQGYFLPKS